MSFGQVVVEQVVAQVCGDGVQVRTSDDRVLPEQGRLQEGHMHFEVRHVVLLRHHVHGPTHSGCDVLAHGVDVLLARLGLQDVVLVQLHAAQKHLLDLALVVHLRHHGGALQQRLDLRKPLRLAEDGGVADRHHIQRPVKI